MNRVDSRTAGRVSDAGRRVALAAGGSAGHVTVALAIAEAWRERAGDGLAAACVGAGDGIEPQLVARAGLPLRRIPARPFRRQRAAGKASAVLALPRATLLARRALRELDAEIVVATGAYAALPTVLAARSLGLAIAVHEANVDAGLANRMAAPFADVLLASWDAALAGLRGRGVRCCTGTPVRGAFRRETGEGAATAWDGPGAGARPARLLVTAGGEGSPFLDAALPALVSDVARRLGGAVVVRHQVGLGDAAAVRAAYARREVACEVVTHLDDVAAAYGWADAAVTGAGAATLAELAAWGLPAVPVPVPGVAGDHQRRNAVAFAAATGAPLGDPVAWRGEEIAATLASWLAGGTAWREAAARMRSAAAPDAGARVVDACEAALARRRARRS